LQYIKKKKIKLLVRTAEIIYCLCHKWHRHLCAERNSIFGTNDSIEYR